MRSRVPTSTDLAILFALLTGGLLLGCDRWEPAPGIDEDIEAFVKSEPLPAAQQPRLVFADDSLALQVFRVSFGEARDCPSGCFYSKAYGLALRDRIGWMGLDAYGQDDSVRAELTYFEVHSGDEALFSENLRRRFRRAVRETDGSYDNAAYDQFLEMLGRAAEIPSETLLALAQLLSEQYRPALGRALLENPVVRSSAPILEVLANLPDRGGYQAVRDRARSLLNQLSAPRSTSD